MHGGQENNICGVLGNECQQTGNGGTGCTVHSRMLFSPHLLQKTKSKFRKKYGKKNLAFGTKINLVVPL